MDIEVKASNVEIEIASGKIELIDVNVNDLIKGVISEVDIDGIMDAIKVSIKDYDLSELAVWLDINYDFNGLIRELDDDERSGEILDQLIDDMDND